MVASCQGIKIILCFNSFGNWNPLLFPKKRDSLWCSPHYYTPNDIPSTSHLKVEQCHSACQLQLLGVIFFQTNWINSNISVQLGRSSLWADSSSPPSQNPGKYLPVWDSERLFRCSIRCFWNVPTCFQQWTQSAQIVFYCPVISFLSLVPDERKPQPLCQLSWQHSSLISETQANHNKHASLSPAANTDQTVHCACQAQAS